MSSKRQNYVRRIQAQQESEATKNVNNDHVTKPVIDDQEGIVVATTWVLIPFSNERDNAVKVVINKSFKWASNPYSFSCCPFNLHIL